MVVLVSGSTRTKSLPWPSLLACLPTLHRHPFVDEIHSKVGREEAKDLHSRKLDEDGELNVLAAHHCSVQEYGLPQVFMNLPYYVVSGVFPVLFHLLFSFVPMTHRAPAHRYSAPRGLRRRDACVLGANLYPRSPPSPLAHYLPCGSSLYCWSAYSKCMS